MSGEDQRFGVRTEAGEAVDVIRWSPHGTALALLLENVLTDNRTAIAVMPLGGKPRVLVPYSKDGVGLLNWSPDGDRLAFVGA